MAEAGNRWEGKDFELDVDAAAASLAKHAGAANHVKFATKAKSEIEDEYEINRSSPAK